MAGLNNKTDWENYQATSNSIQNIQAQRQQNLSNARLQNMATNGQNDMLNQASGVMLDTMRPAQLNNTTQGILGKYGVTRPQTVRSQSTQNVGGNTTIINNNTTNNYSGDYGGPVQGRALAFKQQEAGISKFKVWLDNLFARQKDETARRDRDYEKRERALQKEQNKLSRKLEGIGTTIGKALDPRRRESSSTSQIRQLLTMFGIGTLAMNFDKVLKGVDFIKDAIQKVRDGDLSKRIVKDLGGKEGDTVKEAFEGFIGEDGIFGRIKGELDIALRERADAIKSIKKPASAGLNIGETLVNVSNYIADVLASALGGAKYAKTAASTGILRQTEGALGAGVLYGKSNDRFQRANSVAGGLRDSNNNRLTNTSLGDLSARYSTLIDKSDIDDRGNLVNNTSASLIQGKTINTLLDETSTSQVHTTTVMSGFQRLKNTATKHGSAVVDNSFFDSLSTLGVGNDREDVKDVLGITDKDKFQYKYVVTDKSKKELNQDQWKWNIAKNQAKGIGRFSGIFLGGTNTNVVKRIQEGGEAGLEVEKKVESVLREGKTVKIVPSDYILGEGETFVRENGKDIIEVGYKITPELISKIEQELNGIKFELSDKESMTRLENKLIEIKRAKLRAAGKENPQHVFSDTKDQAFEEEFSLMGLEKEYDKEREELRNKNDHFYRSAFNAENRVSHQLDEVSNEPLNPQLKELIYHSSMEAYRRAGEKSKRGCGAAVRNALQKFGVVIPESGMDAYKFNDWCQSHGYATVASWDKARDFNVSEIDPVPGDIVVFDRNGSHASGHVAIYTPNGWVSDFKQGDSPANGIRFSEYGSVHWYRPTNKLLQWVQDRGNLKNKFQDAAKTAIGKTMEFFGAEQAVSSYTTSFTAPNLNLKAGADYFKGYTTANPINKMFSSSPTISVPNVSSFNLGGSSTVDYNIKIEKMLGEINTTLNVISELTKVTSVSTAASTKEAGNTSKGVSALVQMEAAKQNNRGQFQGPYLSNNTSGDGMGGGR